MVATHIGSLEKHLEEENAKADREYEECMSGDLLENIREMAEKYKRNTAQLKVPDK
jgi:kinetochore protein NDC80